MIQSNRIQFISNPHTVQINEAILGITNFEYFSEVKGHSNFESKGINPIIETILTQRNYYPLIPFKIESEERERDGRTKVNYENTASIIDISQTEKLLFEIIPDIFIYPNRGLASVFKKDNTKNIFISPGCVNPVNDKTNKSSMKGSYVNLYLYPVSKTTGFDICNRLKVEKINIEECI